MSTADAIRSAYDRMIGSFVDGLRTRSAEFWIAIGLVVLYLYLIVLPFAAIFLASFFASGQSLFDELTTGNWVEMAATSQGIIFNTVVYAVGTATLTTILGIAIAWVIARTNAPFGRLFYFVAFLGFFFPPVAWEVSWLRLLGRQGLIPSLFGLETLGVGSIPGMIFVGSVRFLSLALILLIPLFASMDKSLEDAGRMSGRGFIGVAKDITIPLLLPGILAVYLLVLLISLGDFRIPLLLGVPNRIHVLSTAIWEATQAQPVNYGLAMAQAAVLVLIALPILFLYRRILGQTSKYATISGRGYDSNPIDVGRWRYPLSGIVGFFLAFTMILPALVMIYGSLIPFWIPPENVEISMMTLEAYEHVLTDDRLLSAVGRTFVIALVGTILLIAGSIISSWIVHKTDVSFGWLIDYLSFVMIGLPSIALAAGLIFVYLQVVPGGRIIYGTVFILIIAFYTRFIAATVKVIEPGVIQITAELLEAGKLAGDSFRSRLMNIAIPLIKGSVVAAFAMRFAIIFLEMPIAVMLQTRQTEMVSVALLRLQANGQLPEIFALGVLLIVFLSAFIGGLHKL